MSVFDPIRPYAELVKWVAGAVVVAVIFFGGRSCGVASKQADLDKAAASLRDARDSLRGCATSLNAVNAQAEQEIADAKAAAKTAEDARKVAQAEADRLAGVQAEREAEFDRRLRIAQRRPECKAWLDTDVRQTCGL